MHHNALHTQAWSPSPCSHTIPRDRASEFILDSSLHPQHALDEAKLRKIGKFVCQLSHCRVAVGKVKGISARHREPALHPR